jgi:hypothetical protein
VTWLWPQSDGFLLRFVELLVAARQLTPESARAARIEREASGRGDTFQVFIGMPGEPVGPAPVIDPEGIPEAMVVAPSPTAVSVSGPSVEALQREIERLQRQLADRRA